MCEVALPNKEITFVYNKEILQKLNNIMPQATAISIQEAIYSGDTAALQKNLGTLLMQSVSSYDTIGENFIMAACPRTFARLWITAFISPPTVNRAKDG